jgi:pimeloyl-ACP methyl ester carboxylesterase
MIIRNILFILIIMTTNISQAQTTGKYADVNGIKMYYEIHGTGNPLVLIHGGGSTIGTTFGKILPLLAKSHQVIAVEMQAHGHTSDRNAPESFVQDADDIAELLKQLNINTADIFGFSNGGQTCLEIAIRHPEKVRKLIIASAFYKRDGVPAGFWQGFDKSKFSDMPQVYKDEFLKINNDSAALMNMFNKDVQRMYRFKDWKDEDIKSIQAPSLVVIGDRDLPKPEHAVEMCRLLPRGRLVILAGTHGSYMGEAMSSDPNSKVPELFVAMVDEFLAEPMAQSK